MGSELEKLIEELDATYARATKGEWKWEAESGCPTLNGSDDHPEMNPVLIARGCGNKQKTSGGVEGCLAGGDYDPLRGCPLQPSKDDRDIIANLHNAYPRLSAAARGWAGLEGLAEEFENEGEKYDESCSATQFVQWLRAREQKEKGNE